MSKSEKTNIKCPNCEEYLPKENINFNKYVGKCDACDSIVEIREEVMAYLKQQFLGSPPPGISINEQNEKRNKNKSLIIKKEFTTPLGTTISSNQKKVVYSILAGFLIIVFLMTGDWFAPIFFTPILAFGLAIMYNIQTITINHKTISIRNSILFFLNNSISSKEIDQLFVTQAIHRSSKGRTKISYPLMAKTKQGKNIKILDLSLEHESAIYLELKIEEYLGIEDKKMKGEYFK